MIAIAHRTLEKYKSRHRTLVCKWTRKVLDRGAPENRILVYYDGGHKEFQYRKPTQLELAMFLQMELAEKHSHFALLGHSGQKLKSRNYRKYSSFDNDRCSLLYFFRQEISDCPQMDPSKRAEIEQAISILGVIGGQIKKLSKNKAIHQDAKSDRQSGIPKSDWTRLSAVLMSTYSNLMEQELKTHALHAAILFSVALATGVQPGAWARATWADVERTSVRFFAPTREVAEPKISENKSWNAEAQPKARYRDVKFDPTYFEHIQRHFHFLDQIFEGCDSDIGRDIAIETYVKGCGKAILAARRKIKEWDGDATKAYTLRVARSQFPALQTLTDSIRQAEEMGWDEPVPGILLYRNTDVHTYLATTQM